VSSHPQSAHRLAAALARSVLHAEARSCGRRLDILSDRELELLILLSRGLVQKEAAAAMGVSLAAVREYWRRIKTKWDVRTAAEATASLGELEPRPASRSDTC